MTNIAIIEKKRDGGELTTEEIRVFVNALVRGEIPDYQAAAWCMAVYLNGMSKREIIDLTLAMAESGDVLDLSGIVDFAVDKHSSGGVGDKTTLVVMPLVVACGVPVGKMSGRGLSFSGGTLDKMESIAGFNINLTTEQFLQQLKEHGIVLSGQSADLAPADGILYSLRDVTGTVPTTPLVASSIMSKKIAAGAQGIVLDVKCGNGAFMPTPEAARDLARLMIEIGKGAGRRVTALVSDMNQPLGHAVGNALEVREAIETLHGGGPEDFVEHCIVIAGHMLRLAGRSRAEDLSDVRPLLEQKLANGEAFEVFRRMVAAQGGDVAQVDDPDKLPAASVIREVAAPRTGYLEAVHAREIGLAAVELGAGRKRKGDSIDHAVGIVVGHKVGDYVEKGGLLFTIYAQTDDAATRAAERVLAAHSWVDNFALPLFYDTITD